MPLTVLLLVLAWFAQVRCPAGNRSRKIPGYGKLIFPAPSFHGRPSQGRIVHNMSRDSANRGVFVRTVSVLAIALMCVMGMAQATHSHNDNDENSTTARHTCSICATAHAGISTATIA